MRITAEAKTATRQRILQVATDLFVSQGWQNTTTRDIAVAAGIATGTLFNYFATKEGIAAVPHLGYRREGAAASPEFSFRPINPLTRAGFTVV